MNETVLKVENLSKVYRLGQVGTGTISHDLNRWWAGIRGKEDPFSKVGSVNDRTQQAKKGEYVKALSDINFEVKKGEVLGIIGKNGAGKSTLLKVISQITAPTTGSIKAKGRIASLLEVGTGMHPEMTGKENVYLNGTILGMTKKEIDAKFEEIMDFAGCAKYADTPVKRYSSGMKVRLGFAVAAFLEPEILIVDEVLAVGDAEFQKKAIGKMQDISAGGGRTLLFVSHNMRSVKSLCSRGILLENGQTKIADNIDVVIENYLTSSGTGYTLTNPYEQTLNNKISIKNVSLKNSENVNAETFDNTEEINVCIDIEVKADLKSVRSIISICDKDESIIFTSTDQKINSGIYQRGNHTIKCVLPSKLFNEREYYVWFSMGIQGVERVIPRINIAKFNILLLENYSVSNYHSNKWPGLVAPVVNWEAKHLESIS